MTWLPLEVVDRYVPAMRAQGVSAVARSKRGFLTAYRQAGGHEPLYDTAGRPTRRHLALIAWAYSPG